MWTRTIVPDIYVTNHQHSRVVCSAIAQGCKGHAVPPVKLLEAPAVVYGILRGCGDIVKQCEWVGRDYFHIDHGYFKRGHYEGYYRISRNGFQYKGGIDGYSPKRWESLEIRLKSWRKSGSHVIICPISPVLADHLGINPQKWLETVVQEVSKHTERPIIVKHKDGTPLTTALQDAWCLVTHASNAGVDAIIQGIPVIALADSALTPVSWRLADIESPHYPDREPWAWTLAHQQWTLDEMRRGECWN